MATYFQLSTDRRNRLGRLLSFISALLISLPAAVSIAQENGSPTSEPSSAPAKPFFENGEAQIVPAFENKDEWIRHDLFVETEFDSDDDGKPDRVHVSVTRPKQTETEGLKLPVVYETSPYFAGTSSTAADVMWDPRHELGAEPPQHAHPPTPVSRIKRPIISNSQIGTWVPRGYIVVHSSSPGTGLSQGCPTVGGPNEALAPKAVVDWLCGRAKGYTEIDGNETVEAFWSTGKVGMTGTSYNGTLPLAAATTGVEGLEAIIPIAPNTSYYHYYRSNGLVRHPGGYMGEDIDVLYNFIHSGNPDRADHCDCEVRDKEMAQGMDRVTGDYNEFWAGRDYLNQLEPMKAAMLMAHAFNDWNVVPEHSVRIYEAVKAKGLPTRIFFHQGGHGGPPPVEMMNRWFTRFLHGIENGVEDEPKSYIVRENDERDNPTTYPEYPHPDAVDVVLSLTAGGHQRGGLTASSSEKQGMETLEDNFSFSGSTLAQAEWTDHRLLYVSPTLNKPLHISGTAKITIRLASDRPAANLSVWLVSLPWTEGRRAKITDNIITRGWADPQNRESISSSSPLEPGKYYEVGFDLQPDDQIIPEGQQIGLMIFSSDKDFTLHPNPGTQLTVDLDATTLALPVVGGKAAWDEAVTAPLPQPLAAEQ